MVAPKTIKLTSGNTVGRADQYCLTSALAAIRDGSWVSSTAYRKATATRDLLQLWRLDLTLLRAGTVIVLVFS